MLDETMTYSCAVFERPDEPLEEAQRKYRRICDKLGSGRRPRARDRLRLGRLRRVRGGGVRRRVTGLTLSREQAALARERVAAGLATCRHPRAGLPRRSRAATPRSRRSRCSRRSASGSCTYFAAIDRLLEPGGIACVQTILVPGPALRRATAAADWIERYVFPGALIPSLGALASGMTGRRG